MVGRQRRWETIRRRGERGITAAELLVASAIFLAAALAVLPGYQQGRATHDRVAADIALHSGGRRALDELVRLTRPAGYDPAGAGIFGLKPTADFAPVATDSVVVFSLDADQDGLLDPDSAERVGFALFGTEIRRTMDGAHPVAGLPPIARNVRRLRLAYFDGADRPIPNPPEATYALSAPQMAAVRRIAIALDLSGDPPGQVSRAYTLSTSLRPRNL